MKRALARVASGESYRQAADAEGYGDHGKLYRLAKRYGLLSAKKEQILAGSKRVALLANQELERRLTERPDEISDRDVTVMGGVAVDKVSAAEGWSKQNSEHESYGSALESLGRARNRDRGIGPRSWHRRSRRRHERPRQLRRYPWPRPSRREAHDGRVLVGVEPRAGHPGEGAKVDLNVDARLEHSSLIRPCKGERVSGDAVVIRPLEHGLFAAIVDVLGHGPEANELTHVIHAFLDRFATADVSSLMTRLHQRLKGTRGSAVGLCAIDSATGHVDYVGIGNTRMRRFGESETRLVSSDGVLGQNMRTPLLQSLELAPGDLVTLYTDGVSDRFTAAEYPGLPGLAPKEVVRIILGRFGKDHDDSACIAIRYNA